jgi:hypothetical protein
MKCMPVDTPAAMFDVSVYFNIMVYSSMHVQENRGRMAVRYDHSAIVVESDLGLLGPVLVARGISKQAE